MRHIAICLTTAALAALPVQANAHPDRTDEASERVKEAADRLADAIRAYEDALARQADTLQRRSLRTEGLAGGDVLERGFGRGIGSGIGTGGGTEVHKLIKDPEGLRRAARDLERTIEESNLFENMADMLIRMAEDVTVVEGHDSLALRFKGDEMASVESEGDNRITLRAGGRRITLDVD